MAIDLSGYWKSVDNKNPFIKSDNGFYKITQTPTRLIISGINKLKRWDNQGFSLTTLNDLGTCCDLEIYWTDSVSSSSAEKQKDHVCKIKIIDNNHTEVISNNYNDKFSFGSWERIKEAEYKTELNCGGKNGV